jgi:hypothetical protein
MMDAEDLTAHYEKEYKKLNRLLRKLKFDLRYCCDWSDDTTFEHLLEASWEFQPTLGDFRFIALMLEVYVRDHLKGQLGLYEKEHVEYMAKRGANVVDFVSVLAREASAESAPLPTG